MVGVGGSSPLVPTKTIEPSDPFAAIDSRTGLAAFFIL